MRARSSSSCHRSPRTPLRSVLFEQIGRECCLRYFSGTCGRGRWPFLPCQMGCHGHTDGFLAAATTSQAWQSKNEIRIPGAVQPRPRVCVHTGVFWTVLYSNRRRHPPARGVSKHLSMHVHCMVSTPLQSNHHQGAGWWWCGGPFFWWSYSRSCPSQGPNLALLPRSAANARRPSSYSSSSSSLSFAPENRKNYRIT
jgi:hypothetical protein